MPVLVLRRYALLTRFPAPLALSALHVLTKRSRAPFPQEILQEFFTCTMYVDCRSLEAYTPVLQALEAIDPDTAMEELGGKLDEAAREF